MSSSPRADKEKEQQRQLDFVHRFIAAKRIDHERRTLLLLHGTGGDEDDMVPLGRQLDPEASLLSPRGKVLERGVSPRFFRRLAEGVFDIEDLKFRTNELADFVEAASTVYGFDARQVKAIGYSNGANIAASILMLRPDTLSGAVLFRSMVPFIPQTLPDLTKKHIFMSSGIYDPIVSKQEAERLFGLFKNAGANITFNWQESGHELTMEEIQRAKEWLHSSPSL